jgi:hypothetical protein
MMFWQRSRILMAWMRLSATGQVMTSELMG